MMLTLHTGYNVSSLSRLARSNLSTDSTQHTYIVHNNSNMSSKKVWRGGDMQTHTKWVLLI